MSEDNTTESARRRAVALSYGDADQAARVVARGYGDLADRIIAEAQRQGIHVYGVPELVALLMRLNLDEQIPPGLYKVIAELLLWVDEVRNPESDNPVL